MLDVRRGAETVRIDTDRIGFAAMLLQPPADSDEQDHGEQRQKRKPSDARLAVSEHISGQERAEGSACIASHVEERMRHAVLPARTQSGQAGALRLNACVAK